MRNLSILSLLSLFAILLAASCSAPGSAGGSGETVKVEFINPSPNPITAKIFDEDGWIIKTEVPPMSSVIEEVEVGLYTVSAKDIEGNSLYFPFGMDSEPITDSLTYGETIDPEDGYRSVRYNFRSRLAPGGYTARHAFDLTFDKDNVYPVADISWYYGEEGEEMDILQDFLKRTENGKNFIMSNRTGDQPLLFPENCAGPFDPIPDEMTVYNNVKHRFPKAFMHPPGVPRKESANYLASTMLFGVYNPDSFRVFAE